MDFKFVLDWKFCLAAGIATATAILATHLNPEQSRSLVKAVFEKSHLIETNRAD